MTVMLRDENECQNCLIFYVGLYVNNFPGLVCKQMYVSCFAVVTR